MLTIKGRAWQMSRAIKMCTFLKYHAFRTTLFFIRKYLNENEKKWSLGIPNKNSSSSSTSTDSSKLPQKRSPDQRFEKIRFKIF